MGYSKSRPISDRHVRHTIVSPIVSHCDPLSLSLYSFVSIGRKTLIIKNYEKCYENTQTIKFASHETN